MEWTILGSWWEYKFETDSDIVHDMWHVDGK